MLQLAQPSDRKAVNSMARQVHAMHVDWRPDIYEMVDEMYPSERFEKAIEAKELYTAKQDGTVVGYALVKIRNYAWPGVVNRKVLVLDEFCVDENHRRQGIGRQMMEDLKLLAREFGCTDIQLGVYPQNESAIALYESAGMKVRSIDYQMQV